MRFVSTTIACLLIVLPAAAGLAQTKSTADRAAECAKITDPKARLECYDAMAKALGAPKAPAQSAAAAPNRGKWLVQQDVNPLDDSKTVNLILAADKGKSDWGTPIGLIIRCQSGETDVIIGWGEYLGNDATVTWRAGTQPAVTEEWSTSTDKKATFYPHNAVKMIRTLMNVSTLVVQVTPYLEGPRTAEFDLRGLSDVIGPLKTACGWE